MLSTRRQPAFSLLELVIVLVVMIGLLAIVWPNLQRPLSRTTLSEAAQVLREVIDETRYQATVQGVPQFVHLSQGLGEFQSGTIEAFLAAGGNDFGSSGSTVAKVKQWKLPAPVVVGGVSWALDSRSMGSDAFTVEDGGLMRTTANKPVGAASDDAPSASATLLSDTASGNEAGLSSGLDWWLPFLATGQGRDARIELRDNTIQQSLTVTYEAATGALEISR